MKTNNGKENKIDAFDNEAFKLQINDTMTADIARIPNNLYFNGQDNEEILRFQADGEIYFKGERITTNRDIEVGMARLLEQHNLLPRTTEEKLDAFLLSLSNAERTRLYDKLTAGETS